jgi:hypothetical protein
VIKVHTGQLSNAVRTHQTLRTLLHQTDRQARMLEET